jgi:hypothetical protein
MKWFLSYASGSHANAWIALGVMIVFDIRIMHCLVKACLLAADTQTR